MTKLGCASRMHTNRRVLDAELLFVACCWRAAGQWGQGCRSLVDHVNVSWLSLPDRMAAKSQDFPKGAIGLTSNSVS